MAEFISCGILQSSTYKCFWYFFERIFLNVTELRINYFLCRYNDYKHDPLSKCSCTPPYSAENAISARSDLNPANGSYPFSFLGHRNHGGTDCKVGLKFCLTENRNVFFTGAILMVSALHSRSRGSGSGTPFLSYQ